MKKTIFSRTLAFLFACIMCMGLSVTAFAAEPTENISARAIVPDVQEVHYLSLENEECTFTLPSAMLNATFEVVVYGKADAIYTIHMQNGATHYDFSSVNGNGGRSQRTLSYASSGPYFFTIESSSNSTDNYTVVINVYNN